MPSPRILLLDVRPQVDCGRFPAKACVGDTVPVGVTVVRDGHVTLRAAVRYRHVDADAWREEPLVLTGNDRFEGAVVVDVAGRWELVVEAWVDRESTFLDELDRKRAAGQSDLTGELSHGEQLFGAGTIEEWRARARTDGARADRVVAKPVEIDVERERARFGAWYELFPRSFGGLAGVTDVLPQLAELGFDVVYLPPIHPIGVTNRKGRNNSELGEPGDPGSPWAIGGAAGGHDTINPELGTEAEFAALVARARELDIEVALDFALQCSPDHPWLREHPAWFERRPDGTIAYAENPPKRYQDIHNFNWDTPERKELWHALRDVVLGWCARGVRVFRVDNPHTKPLPFWEWLIAKVRAVHPDTVFLSEAFTRPAAMSALAKIGFSQSYTYFTWKNTKPELVEFVEQIRGWSTHFRPNMWPNTPDILHAYLQEGGQAAFEARLVLAATLSPSYGIYSGFEACENVPVRAGSEEYLDSEKYEVKQRRIDGPMLPLIRRLNEIRREHPALQRFETISWLETTPDEIVGYAKIVGDDVLFVVVNLDTAREREGLCDVPTALGLPDRLPVTDLLTGARHTWRTGSNYLRLRPGGSHIMRLDRAAAG
jgi:starch synthase (maltosyl-transferring)